MIFVIQPLRCFPVLLSSQRVEWVRSSANKQSESFCVCVCVCVCVFLSFFFFADHHIGMCDSRGHGSATSENIISDFQQTWIEDTWLTSTLVFSLVNIKKKRTPLKDFYYFTKTEEMESVYICNTIWLSLSALPQSGNTHETEPVVSSLETSSVSPLSNLSPSYISITHSPPPHLALFLFPSL